MLFRSRQAGREAEREGRREAEREGGRQREREEGREGGQVTSEHNLNSRAERSTVLARVERVSARPSCVCVRVCARARVFRESDGEGGKKRLEVGYDFHIRPIRVNNMKSLSPSPSGYSDSCDHIYSMFHQLSLRSHKHALSCLFHLDVYRSLASICVYTRVSSDVPTVGRCHR